MGYDSEAVRKLVCGSGRSLGTDQAGYEAQLGGMKMFWKPADAVAFNPSDGTVEAMDSVRDFSFEKGLTR